MGVPICEAALATPVNHRGMMSLLVRTKFSGVIGRGVIRGEKRIEWGRIKAGEKGWPQSTDEEQPSSASDICKML